MHGADFHLAHQFVREIQCRFHGSQIPRKLVLCQLGQAPFERREFAEAHDITAAFAGSESNFQEYLAKATEGRGADAVLLTAGNPAFVATALRWLREGGTCTVFASLHPESDVQLDPAAKSSAGIVASSA
jgi:Zn-dependent alcohol dehydrogenase